MDNTQTEVREEENTTQNGQEYDAVGGGHSIYSSSDEWEDTTVTEVCEENVSNPIQERMTRMTHTEEDFQGLPRNPEAGNAEEPDGSRLNVNNHLHLLMDCLIMDLEPRIHTIAQNLTTLISVMTILSRIFQVYKLITNMKKCRYDQLTKKFESNKRKNDELDRQLENGDLRLQLLELNGPQDGSVLLQINLKQHVSMQSGIFYTRSHGHNGYKMKITIEEDWVDVTSRTGRNFNVDFTLLEGEMDALLPWPFLPQISFTFIDSQGGHHVRRATQAADMRAFQRPVQDEQKHFCFNILFREVQHCTDDGDILCLLVEVHNDYRSLAASRAPE